jgi:hypothetical protein
MAPITGWTEQDIAKLEQAIASGVDTVTFPNGRMIRYQSIDAMMTSLAAMRRAVYGDGIQRGQVVRSGKGFRGSTK